MRGRSLALLFILASLAASLAPAGSAAAAVGDLAYRGCVGSDDVGGCTPLPLAPLDEAAGIAVSPAGDSVHVAAGEVGVVATLARGSDGSLSYRGCLGDSPVTTGCIDLAAEPLKGASGVAVSPDGASVYALGEFAHSIVHFPREPGGSLAFGGCLSRLLQSGCELLGGEPVVEPRALAVSPDGASVYVASRQSDSISHLVRGPGGQLTFEGCHANTAGGGCDDLPGAPLSTARDVVVTPDGRFVYAVGRERDSVARFARLPGGQLEFGGCLADVAGAECTAVPEEVLSGGEGLAVSPDGRYLYVAANDADILAQFAIAADGDLSFESCLIAGAPAKGCVGVPGGSLSEPRSLALSPDGRALYLVGGDEAEGLLAHFARNPANGRIALAACFAGAVVPDSNCADLPGRPLLFPEDIAVSPDGSSLYIADFESDAVVSFARDTGKVPPVPPGPTSPAAPPARCAGRAATIVGTGGADTLRGTPRRDVIAALGGADAIRGRGGADLICGGAGRDAIFGGGGGDRCLGGSGRDEISCERGRKS